MRFLFFIILSTAKAQTVAPPITLTPSAPVKVTLGAGLLSIWNGTDNTYTLQVDNLTTWSYTTPPTSWPPVSTWCKSSTQLAEDGDYIYACHSGISTLTPFRIAVNGTTTVPATSFDPTDSNNYWLKDDFPQTRADLSPFGEIGWYAVGTLGNVNAITGHPGIKSLSTTSVAGSIAYLRLDYSSSMNFASLADFATWQTTNIVLLDNASGVASLSNLSYQFGLASNGGNCTANSWCIIADTIASIPCTVGTWNTTDWMYVSAKTSVYTCLDSGVPTLSGTWYKLGLTYTNGTVTYSINGSATQSLAVINSSPMTPVLSLTTRNGVRSVWQDFWSFKGIGLNR